VTAKIKLISILSALVLAIPLLTSADAQTLSSQVKEGEIIVSWDYQPTDSQIADDTHFQLYIGPNERANVVRPTSIHSSDPYREMFVIPIDSSKHTLPFHYDRTQCMAMVTAGRSSTTGNIEHSDFSNEICVPPIVKNIQIIINGG
jgi:hypothetical protein